MDTNKPDTYQIITDRVLAKMGEGVVPWHKPWVGGDAPANFVSKRPYRGINVLMTMLAGYDQPYWLTFNQAKELGGSVRKGEKGTPLVLWKFLKKEKADGSVDTIPLIKYFTVFNIEQVDGLKMPVINHPDVVKDDARAEAMVASFLEAHPGLKLEHTREARAYYRPSTDTVHMPSKAMFTSTNGYYNTLFHELVHATGHESRLKRDLKGSMGAESYSHEELVAEIGAAFLMHLAGLEIEPSLNTVAYLQSWSRKLAEDKKAIVVAAGRAQRAVDLVLGVTVAEVVELAAPVVADAVAA